MASTNDAEKSAHECEEQAAHEQAAASRRLTPAAERALAEAAERRRQAEQAARPAPEVGGREGSDPVRYGDWEVKGIASDF